MKRTILIILLLCSFARASWVFDSDRNDYVSVADNVNLSLPETDWSIAFWYKIQDDTQAYPQYLLSWGTYAADPSINVRLHEDGDTYDGQLQIIWKAYNTKNIYTTGTYNTFNTWYHVTIVFDGDLDDCFVYINGSLDGSETSLSVSSVDVADTWNFGAYNDEASNMYGSLAEAAMWTRELSAEEIDRLSGTGDYAGAAQSPSDFATSLVWHWDMYDALDTTSQSGSLTATHTGTAVNSADHPVTYSSGPSIPIIQYNRRQH